MPPRTRDQAERLARALLEQGPSAGVHLGAASRYFAARSLSGQAAPRLDLEWLYRAALDFPGRTQGALSQVHGDLSSTLLDGIGPPAYRNDSLEFEAYYGDGSRRRVRLRPARGGGFLLSTDAPRSRERALSFSDPLGALSSLFQSLVLDGTHAGRTYSRLSGRRSVFGTKTR